MIIERISVSASQPRDINSGKPFQRAYTAYRESGWLGTLPLPPKAKKSPPTGWTGRAARHPEQDDIDGWLKLQKYRGGNICLHMGVTECGRYETIGIDVDDYGDKQGAKQLVQLQDEYGKLPATWISSARNLPSGIRFYRVPVGYAFRGKAASAIDIIQKRHRYAVVWPSYNPDAEAQYRWTSPEGEVVTDMEKLPFVDELPLLSPDDAKTDQWFNFLTQGGMADSDQEMDMDMSVDEIELWARSNFVKAPTPEDEVCDRMKKAVETWQTQIEAEESSHDKITGAHWNLIALGSEGHYDWSLAVSAVEQAFVESTLARGKRTMADLRGEVMRSRINAIRKIKGDIDSGKRVISLTCTCYTEEIDFKAWSDNLRKNNPGLATSASQRAAQTGTAGGGSDFHIYGMNSGTPADPADYAFDDDGNARHWLDMFQGHAYYVPEHNEWIMWTGVEWVLGEGIAIRSYELVKKRQVNYARQLRQRARQLLLADDPEGKPAKALADRWTRWSERSGMVGPKEAALKTAANHAILHESEINKDPFLLGVANGVLRLHEDGSVSLNDMSKDNFITLNTGVLYLPWSELDEDAELLENTIEQWLPNPKLRLFVQKLVGYSLLGDNRERIAVWLQGTTGTGKSTFLNTVMAALGDYAGPVDLSIFRGDRHTNPALVTALPRRIITASEASQSNVLHADVFKRITGGEAISAELKYSNEMVNRVPCFTPWVATNSPPSMPGADIAVRRRTIVVPFDVQITEDPQLGYRLRTSPGVRVAMLSWAVEGWRMYCEEGLGLEEVPDEVKESGESFSNNLSDLAAFLHERFDRMEIVGKNPTFPEEYRVSTADAFDEYEKWCLNNRSADRDKLSRRRFATEMQGLGVKYRLARIDGSPQRAFVGIRLKGVRKLRLDKS